MQHTDLVLVGGRPQVVTDALFRAHGLQAWYVRAAVNEHGEVAAVAQTAPGDGCTVVSGSRRWSPAGEVAYGVQCVGIVPHPLGWQVTWVRAGGTHYGRIVLDRALRPTTSTFANRPVPDAVRGTTQGFLDVELDGEPRWTDLHRTTVCAGVTVFLPMTRGRWTLGQDAHADRLLIYDRETETLFVAADGYTPVASRLVVDDAGEPWVLPAGSTTPIGRAAFRPWAAPMPSYAPVVPIGRPLWMGFFEFGAESGLPANCHIPVTQGAPYLEVRGPSWAYVSGQPDGDPAAIERAIADVSALAPVVAYVPRRAQHILPTSAEIQGIEAYLGADESDETFVARLTAAIRRSPRAVLIAQCYSSNHTLTPDLRRVPGLVSRLARDHANVEGILVFSAGPGRATGWRDHPEVHGLWRQVFAGIPGAPPIAVRPTPTPQPTPQPTPEPEPTPEPPPEPQYRYGQAHRPDEPIGGSLWWDIWRWITKTNWRKKDFRFWR